MYRRTPMPRCDCNKAAKQLYRNQTSEWSFINRQMSGTSSDNEWQRVTTSGTTSDNEWQRVTTSGTTSDNEWQRMTTSGTTSDNKWYNKWQRVTTVGIKWREVTMSGNFGQISFFQIILCWYEPFFISLQQRLLQTVVIDVFKIYANFLRVLLSWYFLTFQRAIYFLS